MKKILVLFTVVFSFQFIHAQGLKSLLKNVTKSDSSGTLNKIFSDKGSLSTNEVASGLKEALNIGVTKGAQKLSTVDGFFRDAAIKILLPPEAKKVESTLRGIGLNKQVDDAILSMNRAAEDAAKSAAPIFVNAIKQMTIQDAWSILKGSDSAATSYLKQKTTASLTEAFRPVIEKSLEKVDATKYWNTVFSTYNKMPLVNKVDPDLTAYVTEKALSGMLHEVALQEAEIRKNPMARTTELLKKVFAK